MTPSLLRSSSPFAHFRTGLPFRSGDPCVSSVVLLSEEKRVLCTRLAALGRFDDVDWRPSAFRPGIEPEGVCGRQIASSERQGRFSSGPSDPRAAQPRGREASDTLEGGATLLVPEVDREESLAVAAAVDRLLDRHPRAELPRAILAGVDDLVRRAVEGPTGPVQTASSAALIVAVQRGAGADRVLLLSRAASPRFSRAEPSLVELLARTAALAPETERAAVLVVLARLLAGDGRADEARRLAHDAVRLDPHHVGARRLAAALGGNLPETQAVRALPPRYAA